MDTTQIPTLQAAGNSTTSDANTTNSDHRIPSAVLAIMIPFIVIITAAVVGVATYFIVRRRRLRRRAQQRDEHTDSGFVGMGPAMEEGLNELGEAPPPYLSDGAMKEQTDHVEIEEVLDEPTEPPPAYIAGMAIVGAPNNTS